MSVGRHNLLNVKDLRNVALKADTVFTHVLAGSH